MASKDTLNVITNRKLSKHHIRSCNVNKILRTNVILMDNTKATLKESCVFAHIFPQYLIKTLLLIFA